MAATLWRRMVIKSDNDLGLVNDPFMLHANTDLEQRIVLNPRPWNDEILYDKLVFWHNTVVPYYPFHCQRNFNLKEGDKIDIQLMVT